MLSLSAGTLGPGVAGGGGDAEDAVLLRHRELADQAAGDLAARRVLGLAVARGGEAVDLSVAGRLGGTGDPAR